jgi:hypothetical protein
MNTKRKEILLKETTWETQTEIEENIKMNLREIECENDDWTEMAQYWFEWKALILAVLIVKKR